jgi:CRISPR-associated endonuclease Cas2
MYWLICFDIEHDKARTRISRYLEKVGKRVQGSVFEVVLPKESQRTRLIHALQKILDHYQNPGADIRFYRMNPQTIQASHTLSGRAVMEFPASMIV